MQTPTTRLGPPPEPVRPTPPPPRPVTFLGGHEFWLPRKWAR